MVIDNKAIGKRMRQERERLGLSREEFAEMIGLSNYYVGQLERGERQMSLPTLVNIADCLHISLDYLILGKSNCFATYVRDSGSIYDTHNVKLSEIGCLLKGCSPKEMDLFKKLVKVIIPYL